MAARIARIERAFTKLLEATKGSKKHAMTDEKFDAIRAMKVLGHPARMRIVELLATRGPMSWKELSQELGARTGALYNHLDTLEHIIERDSSKRYVLTKQGRDIYNYLNQHVPQKNPEGLSKVIRGNRTISWAMGNFFLPRAAIQYMTSTRARSALSALAISTTSLFLFVLSKNQVVLLSFSPSNDLSHIFAGFFGSLLVVSLLAYVALRAFKARPDPAVLLVASSLSLFLLADFSLALRFISTVGGVGLASYRNLLTVFLALFQGWGAGVVAAGMSVASGVRIEKTLAVSLVLLYATTVIVFLQAGLVV